MLKCYHTHHFAHSFKYSHKIFLSPSKRRDQSTVCLNLLWLTAALHLLHRIDQMCLQRSSSYSDASAKINFLWSSSTSSPAPLKWWVQQNSSHCTEKRKKKNYWQLRRISFTFYLFLSLRQFSNTKNARKKKQTWHARQQKSFIFVFKKGEKIFFWFSEKSGKEDSVKMFVLWFDLQEMTKSSHDKVNVVEDWVRLDESYIESSKASSLPLEQLEE